MGFGVATLVPDRSDRSITPARSGNQLFSVHSPKEPPTRRPRGSGGRPFDGSRLVEKWRPFRVGIAGVLLAGGLAASCGLSGCRPVTVVVAKKEERARLERVPHGPRTTEAGRLEEERRTEIVRDFWVRDQHGAWYPVSAEQYRAVEVGQSLQLCR